MRRALRLAVAVSVALSFVVPVYAWGPLGHMTVGRLAAGLLSARAQSMVARILHVKDTPAAVASALADAAEWPDKVARTKYPNAADWHFIDLGVAPDATKDGALWDSMTTAFAKITKYAVTVKNGMPDELEPGSDLKFIAHLVGDIHQPLHVATDQDRGGNCLQITFVRADGGQQTAEMHGLLDSGLFSDRGFGSNQSAAMAARLRMNHLSDLKSRQTAAENALKTQGVDGTVRSWIQEAHGKAVEAVYGALTPPVPKHMTAAVKPNCSDEASDLKDKTFDFSKMATDDLENLLEEQVVTAGARLAALLNFVAE